MKFRHFVGDSPEAKHIIELCDKHAFKSMSLKMNLCSDVHASGLLCNDEGYGEITGFIFKCEQQNNDLKFLYKFPRNGGYVYRPKRTTKNGRRLYELIKSPIYTFLPNEFILKECNANRCVPGKILKGKTSLWCSDAKVKDEKIFLRIPFLDDGVENDVNLLKRRGISPFPKLPGWFKQISSEEWHSLLD